MQGVASSAHEYRLTDQELNDIEQSLANGDVYASQIVDFVTARDPVKLGVDGGGIETVAYIQISAILEAPAPTSQNLLPE